MATPDKVKVEILDACFINSEPQEQGSIIEVSYEDAMSLAGSGRAKLATEDAPKKKAKAAEA